MAGSTKLDALLANPYSVPVYYFAGTEEALLKEQARRVLAALLAGEPDAETTRIDGPVPSLGEVIAAAGAISFFGTPRVVEVRELSPSMVTEKDAEELAGLFGQLENAVLVVTALYKDNKTASSKKAKLLFGAAAKAGFATEVAKPTRRDNVDFLQQTAQGLGAAFAPSAAEALLERAGEDRNLLRSETEKLAAMAGYREISRALVAQQGAVNIEADVFELARLLTGGRRAAAFEKLGQLLALRHEPIAISAALAGSFIDMYRVRCGTEQKLPVATIFKEMGYRGSDWRLQKAKESAARYTTAQLEQCVLCLSGLDAALKSSALPDKSVLLEAALGELAQIGARR